MKKIKLIIWDLDETFWNGTLSEEGIVKIDENIQLVKTLTKRGIINSITSKNDFQKAKNELVKLGIWEYFVFPKISWLPKGQLVKEIISNCNLRPDNVLFLDDNHLNLEEVKFYNKNIYCELPSFISQINLHEAFKGKDDSKLTRLNQYKILEKKEINKKNYSDNLDFLRNSNISVNISKPNEKDFDRIHELIQRTNQLNFTKLRSTKSELNSLLYNNDFNNNIIYVKDRYGDYGLVGFVSIKDNKYCHFVFSCRVLNLGIEQFVDKFFGSPIINIIPPVSSDLYIYNKVDWIEFNQNNKINTKQISKNKLLIKGGCDLLQSGHYLDKYYKIDYELNQIINSIPVRIEHTSLLSLSNLESNKIKSLNIPFINGFDNTNFFNSENLVYSILMDCDQYLYEFDSILIPLSYNFNNNSEEVLDNFKKRNINFSKKDISVLLSKLKFVGKMNTDILEKNLSRINNKLDNKVKLTFIGASSSFSGNSKKQSFFINSLNQVVINFCSNYNHHFIDIDKIFTDDSYFRDSYKHYTRKGYEIIAKEINEIYAKEEMSKNYWLNLYLELKHFYRKIRLKFK